MWKSISLITLSFGCMSALASFEKHNAEFYGQAIPNFPIGIEWTEDFDQAKQKSEELNKPLFVLFTGSDWCANCRELKAKILDHPQFIECLKDHFIFVVVDFPLHYRLSNEALTRNQKLKEDYQISGFPTAVIFMPSGDKLVFAGRFPKNPDECAKFFLKEVEDAKQLDNVMANFDKKKGELTKEELEKFYRQAKQMGKKEAAEKILKSGLEKEGQNAYFLRERYRLLVEEQKKDSKEAEETRNKLLKDDIDNSKGHQLYIAVCDFQAMTKGHCESKTAIEPLVTYLKKFGSKDQENSWRVELMLAHYLRAKSEKVKALEFATAALAHAPAFLQPDIEKQIAAIKQEEADSKQ